MPHLLVLALALAAVLQGGAVFNASPDDEQEEAGHNHPTIGLAELASPAGESLLASTVPLSRLVATTDSSMVVVKPGVESYVATQRETVADIASQTGRSVETLLWANNLSDPNTEIPAGTELRIPAADGTLHVVRTGDTVASIADQYGVTSADIINYAPNHVGDDDDLIPHAVVLVPGGEVQESRTTANTYTIQEGDTLRDVAATYGVELSTLIAANTLEDPDLILPGQQIVIPPSEGVMVEVQAGDTLWAIATRWGADPDDIYNHPMNGMTNADLIQIGQLLFIPGAAGSGENVVEVESEAVVEEQSEEVESASEAEVAPTGGEEEPQAENQSVEAEPVVEEAPAEAPQAEQEPAPAPEPEPEPVLQAATGPVGSFIWPTQGTITQGFGHTGFSASSGWYGAAGHTGLDIANGAYTPIVAADGGTVVSSGWFGGYGYAVGIDHGNGFMTWYGHMAEMPAVWVGQQVSQGQYIGPMGTTGASTGNHLHFEIRLNGEYQSPLSYLN